MGGITKRMMNAEAEANDDISAKRFDGTFTPGQSNGQLMSYTQNQKAINQSKSALEILQSSRSTPPIAHSGKDIHQQLIERALERERKLKEVKQQGRKVYKSDFDYSRSRLASGSYKKYEFDSADQKQRDKILGKTDLTPENDKQDSNSNEPCNNRSVNKSSKIEDRDTIHLKKRPLRRSERIAEAYDQGGRFGKGSRQENNASSVNRSFKRPHFHEPQTRKYNPYA